MKLEDYKTAMNDMETDNVKYEHLLSAIDRDEYRLRRKAVTAGAAAVTMAAVLGATAAAESGFFKSMQKAFYTGEYNTLIASDPSEYAFMPEVNSVSGDGITVNVTEAAVDSHGIMVFMDIVFENGIPQEIINDKSNDYKNIGFESFGIGYGTVINCVSVEVEDNVVSLYLLSDCHHDDEWRKDGITVGFEKFGCLVGIGTPFYEFKAVSDISGSITIPPEQVKYNESRIAFSEIDGVPVQLELSLLGIDLSFGSEEDYNKVQDKITQKDDFIDINSLHFYMKDGSVKDREGYYKILSSSSGGIKNDGTYWIYLGFNAPLDIEQIEKITIHDYEFNFK